MQPSSSSFSFGRTNATMTASPAISLALVRCVPAAPCPVCSCVSGSDFFPLEKIHDTRKNVRRVCVWGRLWTSFGRHQLYLYKFFHSSFYFWPSRFGVLPRSCCSESFELEFLLAFNLLTQGVHGQPDRHLNKVRDCGFELMHYHKLSPN